jgi:hypothetical protein
MRSNAVHTLLRPLSKTCTQSRLSMALRDPLIEFGFRDPNVPRELVRLSECDPEARDAPNQAVIYARLREASLRGVAFAMCVCSRFAANGVGRDKSDADAFAYASQAAALDYPPGHYEMGRLHELGVGTSRNLPAAKASYQKALDLGYGIAGHRIGKALLAGDFGETRIDRAVEYFELADKAREPLGAFELAEIYETDRFQLKDFANSLRWYRRASELGSPFASLRLSIAYTIGELGVAPDPELAAMFGDLAVRQSS